MKVKKETAICPKCQMSQERLKVLSYNPGIKSMAESAQRIAKQGCLGCNLIGQVHLHSEKFRKKSGVEFSDAELLKITNAFRARIKNGESLDSLLPEAFALINVVLEDDEKLVKEKVKKGKDLEKIDPISLKLVGEQSSDNVIRNAIGLHKGFAAEAIAGSQKDASYPLLLAAYLNALGGKGVHVICINEEAIAQSAEFSKTFFNPYGITIGICKTGMSTSDKQKAYNSDITLVTASEVGFDFMRDNLCLKNEDKVLRELDFAIAHFEVLLNQARTPLIMDMPTKDGDKKTVARLTTHGVLKLYNRLAGTLWVNPSIYNGQTAIKNAYGFDILPLHRTPKDEAEFKKQELAIKDKEDAQQLSIEYNSVIDDQQIAFYEYRATFIENGKKASDAILSALSKDDGKIYSEKRNSLNKQGFDFSKFEQELLVSCLDREWMEHITELVKMQANTKEKSLTQELIKQLKSTADRMYADMIQRAKNKASSFALKVEIQKK